MASVNSASAMDLGIMDPNCTLSALLPSTNSTVMAMPRAPVALSTIADVLGIATPVPLSRTNEIIPQPADSTATDIAVPPSHTIAVVVETVTTFVQPSSSLEAARENAQITTIEDKTPNDNNSVPQLTVTTISNSGISQSTPSPSMVISVLTVTASIQPASPSEHKAGEDSQIASPGSNKPDNENTSQLSIITVADAATTASPEVVTVLHTITKIASPTPAVQQETHEPAKNTATAYAKLEGSDLQIKELSGAEVAALPVAKASEQGPDFSVKVSESDAIGASLVFSLLMTIVLAIAAWYLAVRLAMAMVLRPALSKLMGEASVPVRDAINDNYHRLGGKGRAIAQVALVFAVFALEQCLIVNTILGAMAGPLLDTHPGACREHDPTRLGIPHPGPLLVLLW
ncbi:hypothetical protein Slin15195_G079780 [Septoria linicola]|uniref:Uncharacterized protein n=1 Tax=Septoria linicola TaxID=215465 RepID=A0A9Q9ELR9_9PEZI|nr:hypothetical protein Slin15195_G079780 [Septoria linicola]